MIVDASLLIDAVTDPGPRGIAAREVLAAQSAAEPLIALGHVAVKVTSERPVSVSTEGLESWNDAVRRAENDETVAVIAHGQHVAETTSPSLTCPPRIFAIASS